MPADSVPDQATVIRWIIQLFERETSEGRPGAVAFPEGAVFDHLPLDPGERVFGSYKDTYHFTPVAIIITSNGNTNRIRWADVQGCTSSHGSGDRYATLTLTDGRKVRIRVADMVTGWQGRVGQLFFKLIERLGEPVPTGLVPWRGYFDESPDDDDLLPNLVDHPGAGVIRDAIADLVAQLPGTDVWMHIAPDDPGVAIGMIVAGPHPAEAFEPFATRFGADGVIEPDHSLRPAASSLAEGANVWHIVWD